MTDKLNSDIIPADEAEEAMSILAESGFEPTSYRIEQDPNDSNKFIGVLGGMIPFKCKEPMFIKTFKGLSTE